MKVRLISTDGRVLATLDGGAAPKELSTELAAEKILDYWMPQKSEWLWVNPDEAATQGRTVTKIGIRTSAIATVEVVADSQLLTE